jgi:hypothetical protein
MDPRPDQGSESRQLQPLRNLVQAYLMQDKSQWYFAKPTLLDRLADEVLLEFILR